MNEQTKVMILNALDRSHTEIHRAIGHLKKDEVTQFKIQALSALKKVAESIAAV